MPEPDNEFQHNDAGWTDPGEDSDPCGLGRRQSTELEGHSPAYDWIIFSGQIKRECPSNTIDCLGFVKLIVDGLENLETYNIDFTNSGHES